MSINRFFIQYFSLTIRFRTVGPQLSSSNIQSRRGKIGGTISRDGSQRISYDSERQMKPWLELGIGALHTISKKRVVMKNIRVKIKNLRAVKSFDFEFPLTRGVNLICGSNGTGKSTIMSVFAKVVYPNALNKYFRNDGCDD
ncbi:TPA: AAA family ATPase, partial [Escherichia coli]|nr:AAA family ATPase [Escherichia coli]